MHVSYHTGEALYVFMAWLAEGQSSGLQPQHSQVEQDHLKPLNQGPNSASDILMQ